MNKRYILEKEIEVLNESKDTDKFVYQISINTTFALLALMTSLVTLLAYKTNILFSEATLLWLFLFLIIIFYNYKVNFKPAKERFIRKHNLLRKKYHELGIDLGSLKKELRAMKGVISRE